MKFVCTQCARCCRNLLETKAKGLPLDADALTREGIYHLPREGGLQAWAWEARRMREAGARRGVHLPFAPSVGVVVDEPRRFLTVVYELRANECPLVDPTNLCGAYEERPVVCRAYPLLLSARSVTISTKCPGAVDPASPADLAPAYGGAARAVEFAYHLPNLALRHLRFLEQAGSLRLVRGVPLDEAEALATCATDLLDHLDDGARRSLLAAMESAREAFEGPGR